MKIEITIEGPTQAISELYQKLEDLSPSMETPHWQTEGNEEKARILLLENENNLDDSLLKISRIAKKLEKDIFPMTKFEFRARNLAYSEPSTGSVSFRDPFRPIPSITIQPWHPSLPPIRDSLTIIIDPQHAFGTGRHPSTRLCLEWIDRMAHSEQFDQWLQGRNVLDFGCGTGLLAIAAVKMGAKSAIGIEIDHQSAQTARKNLELNRVSEKVVICEGSWEVVNGKYDLILANLVSSALLRRCRDIPNHLKHQGKVVISGFGHNQNGAMERFFIEQGLVTIDRSSLEGWGVLVMENQ